ncbi:MAG: YihA family ribosome biogenesis GTP-binding protein [Clostridia bacterium]|nr:YihA family ribosome biogenesis GTP-binding protein [Clostridia bacterium]MBQ2731295.1 YihA family ribosome biogenesis GTP-binding protein [Clostridia bacterium]
MHANDTVLKMTAGRPDQFPRDRKAQIALSGRSNVGKSSLINRLLGTKNFARVSSSPGKTVTVNFYECEKKFYLVDLPGYGFAARSGEGRRALAGIADRYFQNNDSLTLVLQLIDLKVGPTKDDLVMIDFLTQTETPFVIVATKADKLSPTAANRQREAILETAELPSDTPMILFSSKSGLGKEELKKHIYSAVASFVDPSAK